MKIIKIHGGAHLYKLQNFDSWIVDIHTFRFSPKHPSQAQYSSQNIKLHVFPNKLGLRFFQEVTHCRVNSDFRRTIRAASRSSFWRSFRHFWLALKSSIPTLAWVRTERVSTLVIQVKYYRLQSELAHQESHHMRGSFLVQLLQIFVVHLNWA